MSKIAQTPTTRHQVSQLNAKIIRDAKQVNRVFGAGVFTPIVETVAIKATPIMARLYDEYGNVLSNRNANVTDADRREAAAMFAEIERKQNNARIMAEFNQAEEQADALESMRASDMAWINHEVEMAPRRAAYGW